MSPSNSFIIQKKIKTNWFLTRTEMYYLFDELIDKNKIVRKDKQWVLLEPIAFNLYLNEFKEIEGVLGECDGDMITFHYNSKVEAREEFCKYIDKVIVGSIEQTLLKLWEEE